MSLIKSEIKRLDRYTVQVGVLSPTAEGSSHDVTTSLQVSATSTSVDVISSAFKFYSN